MALTEVRAEPLLAVLFWVPTQDPVGKDAVGKDDLSGEQWSLVSLDKLRT